MLALLHLRPKIDKFLASCTEKMAESSSGGNANSVRVGHYKIEKTIGKGNFAVVKLAKNIYTNSEVTYLVVHPCGSSTDATIDLLGILVHTDCSVLNLTALYRLLLLLFDLSCLRFAHCVVGRNSYSVHGLICCLIAVQRSMLLLVEL